MSTYINVQRPHDYGQGLNAHAMRRVDLLTDPRTQTGFVDFARAQGLDEEVIAKGLEMMGDLADVWRDVAEKGD